MSRPPAVGSGGHSVVASARWNAVGQGGALLVRYGVTLVLLGLLDPGDFGVMAAALVVVGVMDLFAGLGTGTAIIQREEITPEFLSSVFWFNLLFGIGLWAASTAFAGTAAKLMAQPAIAGILPILSANFAISGLGIVQRNLHARNMRFDRIAIADLARAVSYGGVGVTSALQGNGVWALVCAYLAGQATWLVAIWWSSSWRPSLLFSTRDLRQISSFSLNLFGAQATAYLLANADRVIISRLLGVEELGLYATAQRLVMFPVRTATQMLMEILIPALSSLQSNLSRFRERYLRASEGILAVTAPAMIGLAIVAVPLTESLLAERWRGTGQLLVVLAPIGVLQSLVKATGTIYVAMGRTGAMFRWSVVFGAVFVASYWIGAEQAGLIGVAVATGVAYVVLLPLMFGVPFRFIGLPLRQFTRGLQEVAAATLIMGVVTGVAQVALGQVPLSGTLRVSLTIAAGFLSYIAAMFIIRPPALDDLLRLFGVASTRKGA